MKTFSPVFSFAIGCMLTLSSTAFAESKTEMENKKLHAEVEDALKRFKIMDSTFVKSVETAHAYAIYPSISKGGFILGGAGGKGEVYEKGKLIGRTTLAQGTIGAQIGGQVFSQIVLFENENALARFKLNQFKMSAQVTAVAASEGVAARAKFADGVAVITLVKGGLMAEASVGGQKLTFIPLEKDAK